tara:strand:+ start:577 stop:780 length:204 start_codon:yes stop_codon:yes gene_type:complete
MKKLTREQAIVVSGYTGTFNDVEGLVIDASKRLGREVSTTDIPKLGEELKAAYYDDFLELFPTTDKQ